jgi:mRNA-degrading endonuclease RelE of RelBE toxin-antitoxin system
MAYKIDPTKLANRFLQQASPDVRQKVQKLLDELSRDPFVDMKKSSISSLPQ